VVSQATPSKSRWPSCLGFDGAVAGDPQRSDGLDRAAAQLRKHRGDAGQNRSSRRLSVDGVGLAVLAAEATIGTRNFHDGDAGGVEMTSQAGAVCPGAFHPDSANRSVIAQPSGGGVVTGGCRRELGGAEESALFIKGGDLVGGSVGVDTTDDGPDVLAHEMVLLPVGEPVPRSGTGQ
jgi:hypothetical protein